MRFSNDIPVVSVHVCTHDFRPCSRAQESLLRSALDSVETCLEGPAPIPPEAPRCVEVLALTAAKHNAIPHIRCHKSATSVALMQLGLPFVVDMADHMYGSWDPTSLRERYGTDAVKMIKIPSDGGPSEVLDTTLRDFLEKFCDPDSDSTWKVKVS